MSNPGFIETHGEVIQANLEAALDEVVKSRSENNLVLLSAPATFNFSFIPAIVAGIDSIYVTIKSGYECLVVGALPADNLSYDRFYPSVAVAYNELCAIEQWELDKEELEKGRPLSRSRH